MDLKVDCRKDLGFTEGGAIWNHFVKIGADTVMALPSDNPILNNSAVKFP